MDAARLVFLYQDQRQPALDRLAPEANTRGARRSAMFNCVASVVCFGSATLQPEHPAKALIGGAAFALMAGFSVWAASFWTTPRGVRFLERLRQRDALRNGSQTEPVAAAPAGHVGTARQDPPYFSS